MKKSKNSNTARRDRLSELPNELIFHIFWLLPMRYVVRTTLLSKRWKNLWTTADCLNFEDCMTNSADKVRTFVYRALTLWKGSRILKFSIRFDNHLVKSLYSDIDIWLRFATENQVEVLYVDLNNLDYGDTIQRFDVSAYNSFFEDTYRAPQCLYSCSSLKRLVLSGYNLEVHENVHWNQLKCLYFYGGMRTEHVINRVLSGSPQLETLFLQLLENYENLSIQSSSLIHLTIEKLLYDEFDAPSMHTELIISTPKLQRLEMMGVPYSKCLLTNAPCLREVTLGFDGPNMYNHDLFHENDFLEKTLIQILPTIQLVEEIKLSDWCIKALGAMMKKKSGLQFLPHVKLLELNYLYCFEEYKQIVCLLQIFPKLDMLVVQPENYHENPGQIPANKAKRLRRNPPKSFLRHLRMAEVTWINGDDSIFPFIEIVLKYARKLRKMVFRPQGTVPPNSLLSASKKLLRMPKSSPTLELVFL